MFDPERFITDRVRAVDASGIRRVFDLAAQMRDPIDLSIGQPRFQVPEPVQDAAAEAIRAGLNSYTVTQGIGPLHEAIRARLVDELPQWTGPLEAGSHGMLITSGVSGGLLLALLTCVGPGDEVLIGDPYFVMYRHLVTLAGARPVLVDTYPDFQLTAERVEPYISPATKMLLVNSPSNPTGVVATARICQDLVELADQRGLLLLSDEIYDAFCYQKAEHPTGSGQFRCPSPAHHTTNLLLLRGFSKTYAMTGWRLGYAAGPAPVIDQMTTLQQYTFVCAPSMVQAAGVVALDQDMSDQIEAYRRKAAYVVQRLSGTYELTSPGGAFYAFPRVPAHLNLTATQFVQRAAEQNLLIIPGNVFSSRDTHLRISFACDEPMLERGMDTLVALAR